MISKILSRPKLELDLDKKENNYSQPFSSYKDRLKNYLKVRDRIFNNKLIKTNKTRSSKRYSNYWKNFNYYKTHTLASIQNVNNDPRLFGEVELFGGTWMGLLDSGASISCISGILAAQLIEGKIIAKINKVASVIKTADGKPQKIIGSVTTEVKFNGASKELSLLIVPSLKQNLYLGIDFWRAFNIVPQVKNFNICSLDSSETVDPTSIRHTLSADQLQRLDSVINMYPSYSKLGLGKTSLFEHKIDVGNSSPIKQRHYPVSPAIEKLMVEELDRMLELGVIEESTSSWSSPVVLVRKPGKVRLCLDSRKVNAVTVKDAYPLPQIDGILSRLPKANFISSLDLKDAFWQIPLEKASREMTAFTVPGRPLYQFKVMPFGLCNAPQAMCRLMDKVIPYHLREKVFVYLDDLLIISEDFDEHLDILLQVADHLRKANLTINVEKSKFLRREVKYLGHIVGGGVLRADPEKVDSIVQYPVPKSVRQVRRFLGMCGYYRRYVQNFSDIAVGLTNLLKSPKAKFLWTPAANESFEKLKQAMVSSPVLITPDYKKMFILCCDASKEGVGCVLAQLDEEGHERPVAYMSKRLNSAQRNYSVSELECLAAVLAIKKFRAYIEGQPFKVITDHASLKWLMTQKDLTGRLARWSLKLQGFNFEIEHRKGTENIVPDSLSRVYSEEALDEIDYIGPIVDLDHPAFTGTEYQQLKNKIELNNTPDVRIVDGFIYKRVDFATGDPEQEENSWKLWVPEELHEDCIRRAHEPPTSGHGGVAKTYHRLRQLLFWPKMLGQVKNFVKNCETCKLSKAPNKSLTAPMVSHMQSERAFQMLYADLIGPYPRSSAGNIGALVVLDHLTKFIFTLPIKSMKTTPLLTYFENNIFHIFGVPEKLLTDNGSQFTCHKFENFLSKYGVKHMLTAFYAPQANASERVNRSLLAGVRAYIKQDQRKWDENLSAITCALRASFHQSINNTPYFLTFGQQMITHGSTYELLRKINLLNDGSDTLDKPANIRLAREKAIDIIEKSFKCNAQRYNLRTRIIKFNPGQTVYRKTFYLSDKANAFNAKLAPKYVKCKIIKQVSNSTYELEDMVTKKRGIFHTKDLKL
jgi:hypothetical protein